ncbi:tRNA-binding protein [Mycoplasmopsis caviae]|uniref:Phenylalanyl-tRNA synthetase subunit beta n=1 Tax=Mycoplasmopsis caviae TaxID=55603 RepID=A0A3P8MEK0_9BACT|nr:tRNA-binding protein [Mycoplasmopsis caviae]UUD35355.1 tRNA-binding protein [Mycoplasmopsis caviae]VDR41866.1 phenylalanyl-tRNA synthetase subunit beta [Mycoplasmopsis caviae]
MAIFFNLNSTFKNTKIVYFDTSVKKTTKTVYDDMVVFSDNDNNVHSINLLNQKVKKGEKTFGILGIKQVNKIINMLLKHNAEYTLKNLEHFVIGKIIERKVHPKSDKLFVLKVDFGNCQKQIVTNTTYTLTDKYFTFCLPGSITANGLEIVEGKVMNEESNGMLCSTESLGLEADKYPEFKDGFFNELREEQKEEYKGKVIWKIIPELINN